MLVVCLPQVLALVYVLGLSWRALAWGGGDQVASPCPTYPVKCVTHSPQYFHIAALIRENKTENLFNTPIALICFQREGLQMDWQGARPSTTRPSKTASRRIAAAARGIPRILIGRFLTKHYICMFAKGFAMQMNPRGESDSSAENQFSPRNFLSTQLAATRPLRIL